jgi:hypothetical protein
MVLMLACCSYQYCSSNSFADTFATCQKALPACAYGKAVAYELAYNSSVNKWCGLYALQLIFWPVLLLAMLTRQLVAGLDTTNNYCVKAALLLFSDIC